MGGPCKKPVEKGFVKCEHVPSGDGAGGHLVRVFISEEEVECSAHGKRAAGPRREGVVVLDRDPFHPPVRGESGRGNPLRKKDSRRAL